MNNDIDHDDHSQSELVECDSASDDYLEVTFLDLPWEDVLFRYVLPRLSIQTQFQLRRVSLGYKELMTIYFSKAKTVDICRIALRMNANAFGILTENNICLQNLVLRNAQDWLTDQILINVLSNNKKLKKLDLTNCSSVTNNCLQVLAMNCQSLKHLSLRECHWVSVEAVTVLALNCPDIETMDLTGCWQVNDDSVTLIAMQCKSLKYLSLAKIYGLTDFALSVLARNGKSIQHLNLQGCWRLSDDSIRVLAEYGESLQALQIRECRDVTERSLARLRLRNVKIDVRRPPGLQALQRKRNLNLQI